MRRWSWALKEAHFCYQVSFKPVSLPPFTLVSKTIHQTNKTTRAPTKLHPKWIHHPLLLHLRFCRSSNAILLRKIGSQRLASYHHRTDLAATSPPCPQSRRSRRNLNHRNRCSSQQHHPRLHHGHNPWKTTKPRSLNSHHRTASGALYHPFLQRSRQMKEMHKVYFSCSPYSRKSMTKFKFNSYLKIFSFIAVFSAKHGHLHILICTNSIYLHQFKIL